MRPTRLLWIRKTRAREQALAEAREWQDQEREAARARISGLAATVPDPIRRAAS